MVRKQATKPELVEQNNLLTEQNNILANKNKVLVDKVNDLTAETVRLKESKEELLEELSGMSAEIDEVIQDFNQQRTFLYVAYVIIGLTSGFSIYRLFVGM